MVKEQCWTHLSEKQEPIIRRFLIYNSNVLRLTRFKIKKWRPIQERLWAKFCSNENKDEDHIFEKLLGKLKKDLIKVETNNKKFNEITQSKGSSFDHYYFKMSKEIKERLNKGKLISYPSGSYFDEACNFYGFEDPTFYKNDKMFGCYITHEGDVVLYLTKAQRKSLENKGVRFS